MTNRKQLHDQLWAGATQARANSSLKLNEISEPILGLIFLKFSDVRFKRATKEVEAERAKQTSTRKRPITADDYKSRGVMYVPEEATYSSLLNLKEGENIGKAINKAMKQIEEQNRDLAGVLPQNYTALSKKVDENNKILISLLKNFNDIPDDIEGDALGEIYEYFLGNFALAEGQDGGEFFTAQSIVKLLVEVIEPYHGRIFDPACGSGGMFVQSANFVAKHMNGNKDVMDEVAIYGQEKTSATVNIAKMNLAIHGLSGNIKETNSYYDDVHQSIGKFDFVLANPPFNVKGKDKRGQTVIDSARIKNDKRYYLGLPTTQKGEITNANYLWMQMFAAALNDKGRAGFVMHNSASDAANKEREIRKSLVDSGIVDVVIATGGNLFLNVTLSSTLWFFDKTKKGTDREDKILFLNISDIGTPVPGERVKLYWTDEQIDYFAGIVRSYRGEVGYPEYKDERGRCRVVQRSEVRDSEYSLNPRMYIDSPEKIKSKYSYAQKLEKLNEQLKSCSNKSKKLDEAISKALNSQNDKIEWSGVEFSSAEGLKKISNLIYNEWFVKYNIPNKKINLVESDSKFGEIPRGWEIKSVKELLHPIKRKRKIKTGEYMEKGEFPIIDQGQSFIAGYTDDKNAVYNEELILFGDHTRCFKYCDFPFACGADGTQLLLSNDLKRMPQILFYLSVVNAGLQNYEYARHFKFLKILKVLVPDEEVSSQFIDVAGPIFERLHQINQNEISVARLEE